MRRLLFSGIRLKRWILLCLAGLIGLILFVILAFAAELEGFFSIVNMQLASMTSLPIHKYSPKLIGEIVIFFASLVLIILGTRGMIRFLIDALLPEKKGKIMSLLYKHSELAQAPRVVVIGGGTGLNSILSGLKDLTNNIAAIVSVSDEGGSSRKLRYEFGMLPPGDVRNCIVALSDSGPLMARLLEYRFDKGEGLKGHSFGNLLITALTKITGGFDKAIKETGHILAIRGKVLPVTLESTRLCAELENGKVIEQEPNVESHKLIYKSDVKRLFLKPETAKAYPEALDEIRKADIIVLGPGSLYTSIIPNLLVKGVAGAIRKSKAKKVYICNVMTQPGETDDYKASDHVRKVVDYLGQGVLDHVIINSERAPEELYRKYRKQGSNRVRVDDDGLKRLKIDIIKADLMTKKNLLRHDPEKLAKAVVKLV